MHSIARQVLQSFLNLGNVLLQILVPLELGLNSDDIFSVADLPIVHLFEILLELVKFGAKLLALGFDGREAFLGIHLCRDSILSFDLFKLSSLLATKSCQIFSS